METPDNKPNDKSKRKTVGRKASNKFVNTTRKAKIIGTEQYISARTGEILDCQVMEVEERDCNFLKFWIGHVLSAIDELSNSKMKIVFYIFKNMDRSNNTLLRTIDEIVNETGISNRTIIETLKVLEEHNIIRRKTGVVFVNPNVLFRGGTNKRRAILITYNEIERPQFEQPNQEQSNTLDSTHVQ
jgi:hypothetical protein